MRKDNVNFRFYSSGGTDYLTGQVRLGEGEMILSVNGGASPYSIRGIKREHWFEGNNEQRIGYNEVQAAWALVGKVYVGTWSEEGTKYVFAFEL